MSDSPYNAGKHRNSGKPYRENDTHLKKTFQPSVSEMIGTSFIIFVKSLSLKIQTLHNRLEETDDRSYGSPHP